MSHRPVSGWQWTDGQLTPSGQFIEVTETWHGFPKKETDFYKNYTKIAVIILSQKRLSSENLTFRQTQTLLPRSDGKTLGCRYSALFKSISPTAGLPAPASLLPPLAVLLSHRVFLLSPVCPVELVSLGGFCLWHFHHSLSM